jgi:hypothetical protein
MMAGSTRSSGKKREDTIFKGGGARYIFPSALKVLGKCPFVLLVGVCLREGEISGSEKIEKPEGQKLNWGLTAYDWN